MAGNVKLMTSAGGGVILDTATTTATDVTVKVPVTGVNNGTLVCSDSSGNVGIGTIPTATLNVKAQAGQGVPLKIESTDAGGNPQAVFAGSRTYQIGTGNASSGFAGSLFFYDGTAGAERMRITPSGSLLVGNTNGAFATTTSTGFQVGSDGQILCSVAGTSAIFRVTNTGTLVQWRYQGSVTGDVTTNGTTTSYNTSSDYRLKENVKPMQNALATVTQLNPVTYTWKADGSNGQGFIAHELQAVVPDCVTGEKDAVDEEGNPVYQGIDTSFLVATLTKAIQELNEKVEAQAAEIAALKGAA